MEHWKHTLTETDIDVDVEQLELSLSHLIAVDWRTARDPMHQNLYHVGLAIL